eukprot:TRINITY_DN72180_c0_g1_i1.p2 TRINITY_DN72180_c0_g1~~TRINITY_DN72180_c0_g1_i1.p2  ORF type:complete len:164 (-),score=14.38 TRINITY_DN72180_c0_g1_i1:119-610(-)
MTSDRTAVTNAILCVAFVGSDDQPLFTQKFGDQLDDLEVLLVLQSSMDQLEAKVRAASQAILRGDARGHDSHLGVVCPVLVGGEEDYNVYGHVSATQVKVLAVVRDGPFKQRREEDAVVRSLLRQLHLLYVDAVSNPFHVTLETAAFNKGVARIVDHHSTLFV